MKIAISLACALFVTVGCTTPTTPMAPGIRDQIALCSGGITTQISASIEAKIGKDLTEGGKISAGLEDEIRGLYFNPEGTQPSPESVQMHKQYIDCLNQIK